MQRLRSAPFHNGKKCVDAATSEIASRLEYFRGTGPDRGISPSERNADEVGFFKEQEFV
jgi:hypothetical protein